ARNHQCLSDWGHGLPPGAEIFCRWSGWARGCAQRDYGAWRQAPGLSRLSKRPRSAGLPPTRVRWRFLWRSDALIRSAQGGPALAPAPAGNDFDIRVTIGP